MLIKSIFFDLDHTLWDFEKNSELSFKKIFKKYTITINFEKFIEAYIPINFKYWKLYRNGEISKEFLRYNRLKEVFNLFDYEIDDKIINNISHDYIEFLPENNKLMDGAIEILEYLKPKYRLFIITNGFREVQDKKLKNSKIKHYFEAIYDSESVGVKKPDPKIFEHALKDSESNAKESLMVGDNYEADVLGAKKLRINTLHFVAHGEEIHNKNETIFKLIELKSIL
tara:strand:- start:296 stop:976 length:681 start_codon:yes stop_codon:yes gene_type:complete